MPTEPSMREPAEKSAGTPGKTPRKVRSLRPPLPRGLDSRRALIWLFLALLFVPFLYNLFAGTGDQSIPLSTLLRETQQEKVQRVEIEGGEIRVFFKDGTQKRSRKEGGQDFVTLLQQANINPTAVDVEVKGTSMSSMAWDFAVNFLPVVVMIAFFFFVFRQARGAQGDMMGFGKSKAKFFVKGKQDIKFDDVGGMAEAKQELEEIVDFLKNPKKYLKLGARTPKGVLLVGPSGTGKTLLARAVAGEAGVSYLSIAGSEFMEMLVGVGASRVRDLFGTAKKMAPAIIFIDEIDAIGRMRGQGGGMSGHDEREQTLNQILVEMDGFLPNENVVVLAATNRADMLDPALTRPGRFDRRVSVSLPDIEERKTILAIHAKNKPFTEAVSWNTVAKRTVGFSGADLENMLNEAAILVARESREAIEPKDIEEAALKVKMGPSKKRLQSEYERQMTAFHEVGHAIIAHYLPYADAVHRISIVSRGQALGFTLTPPDQDKYQQTRSELMAEMAVLLGGRAAEQEFFGELTGGASSDIEKVTRIARAMVMDFGMSELGPLNFAPQFDMSYGRAMNDPYKVSDAVQAKVDAAMSELVAEAEKVAFTLVRKHKKVMEKIVVKLLEVETLEAEEFVDLVGQEKAKPSLPTVL